MQDERAAGRQGRFNGFLTGFLSALLLAVVIIVAWRHFEPEARPRIPSNIQAPPEMPHPQSMPADAPAMPSIAPGPRPENTFDKAMAAASAFRRGDDQSPDQLHQATEPGLD